MHKIEMAIEFINHTYDLISLEFQIQHSNVVSFELSIISL